MCVFVIYVSYLMKSLFKTFTHLFHWVACLLIEFCLLCIYSGYRPLFDIWLDYTFFSLWLCFHSLKNTGGTEVLIFMTFSWSIYSMGHAFGVTVKNPCLIPGGKTSFSRCFRVLCFTFRFVIHSEWVFV